MTQTEIDFSGKTYDPSLDRERLTTQLAKVRNLMGDGQWRTLSEIVEKVGGSEAGISARLRDMRKPRYGGWKVERKRIGDTSRGLFAYRAQI